MIENLIRTMVNAIVDDVGNVSIVEEQTDSGVLYKITVAKGDVGKLIGSSGRIASAIRTVSKAAGAKQGVRVLVNVMNTPLGQ